MPICAPSPKLSRVPFSRVSASPTGVGSRRGSMMLSEMAAKFSDLPEALANTVAIAQRCNLAIPLGRNYLPEFPTPAGVTIDLHLRNEAAAGLERRLAILYPDASLRDAERPAYVARLDFETKTIQQMGFSGYFLIVADFINWAKRNSVPVGPGRGSGAGLSVSR